MSEKQIMNKNVVAIVGGAGFVSSIVLWKTTLIPCIKDLLH